MPPEPKMPNPYPPATVPNIRSQEFAEPPFQEGAMKPVLPTPALALPGDDDKTVEE